MLLVALFELKEMAASDFVVIKSSGTKNLGEELDEHLAKLGSIFGSGVLRS